MKKVVIVDDESAGRQLIREYLQAFPSMILVGEANNGVDAIKIINEFKPDLIFLDVQMPGMTGFELLPHLEEIPQIIFSTAYDQYALQAFEVHAVDYLLKPYTLDRFKESVQRVIHQDEARSTAAPLAESIIMEGQTYPERILVQSGRKLVTIAVKDIIYIEADGDYSRLISKEASYLSNYGISKIESKLDPETFIRIHRSNIINIHAIETVDKYASSYDVVMRNQKTLRVSRGYMDNIRKLMF